MPHLIVQTKFPMHEPVAEVSFFGSVERETTLALQEATLATLRSAPGGQPQQEPGYHWRQSPASSRVQHLVVNMPERWQARHMLQDVLRVAWMDTFEKSGWTLLSMWNCTSPAPVDGLGAAGGAAASSAAAPPAAPNDKAGALAPPPPPPPPPPPATVGEGSKTNGAQKRDAAPVTTGAAHELRAATSSDVAMRPEVANAGGENGAEASVAGNMPDGGLREGKENGASESDKFEGECANFLLCRMGTGSASGIGELISPHATSLEASLFLGGMSAAHSESAAAQQLMLASILGGVKAAPADGVGSILAASSSNERAAVPGGVAAKGRGRSLAPVSAAATQGGDTDVERADRRSKDGVKESPTDELLVAATMAAAADRAAAGVRESPSGKRKANSSAESTAARAGETSRPASAKKRRGGQDGKGGKD